ncbi:hypothetical protein H5410_031706 [Solanum commersonii]|uniref:Aminotransferase-like plant mobile domain-containing protein n=1 Tax=Solanum commersonii TaxID=4109 RepID=A0A9J5YKX1_SOLCO|nr:hypothetical protein H5410_031706 [Solanum commersonii]
METKDLMENFSSKATRMKVSLLKSKIHHNVASSKSSHSDGSFDNWSVPSFKFGNVYGTPSYWEWVEDTLPRHKEILELIKVYDVVYTSLFTYNYDDNILFAFCELWRIGGLLVQGHFYDEVVPSARELTQIDTQGKLILPKSYLYLFSIFYGLEKDDLHEVSKVRATMTRLNPNPSRHIDLNFLPQTDEENAPFVELDVEKSLRDETNLAAFFICWLCKFVI